MGFFEVRAKSPGRGRASFPSGPLERNLIRVLLMITPPIVYISDEDAVDGGACPGRGTMGGGSIFPEPCSNFCLLFGGLASLESVSSSGRFLLPLRSAFTRVADGGGTGRGGRAGSNPTVGQQFYIRGETTYVSPPLMQRMRAQIQA